MAKFCQIWSHCLQDGLRSNRARLTEMDWLYAKDFRKKTKIKSEFPFLNISPCAQFSHKFIYNAYLRWNLYHVRIEIELNRFTYIQQNLTQPAKWCNSWTQR